MKRFNHVIDLIDQWIIKYQKLLLWLETVVIIGVILTLCFSHGLDGDEAYTYKMVKENDFVNIVRVTASDIHPPLYYFLVEIVVNLCGLLGLGSQNMLMVRIAGILGLLLTLTLSNTLVAKRFGVYCAAAFNLVMGLAPTSLYYNYYMRMYSWLLAFTLGSILFAYEITIEPKKRSNWIFFFFFGLAAAYTQYFAVLTVAGVYLYLAVYLLATRQKRFHTLIITGLATVIAYVPWLFVMYRQYLVFSSLESVQAPTFDPGGLFSFIFDTNIEMTAVMGVCLLVTAALVFIARFRKTDQTTIFFLAMCILNFAFTYLTSIWIGSTGHHGYHFRYVYQSLPLLWLFIIINLIRSHPKTLIPFALWLMILCMSSYVLERGKEYENEAVIQQTEAFFAQNISEDAIIVYNLLAWDIIYGVYLPTQEFVYVEDFNPQDADGRDVWFFDYGISEFTNAQKEQGAKLIQEGTLALQHILGKIHRVEIIESH
jgi:hypothetical protein